ncbi:MAG: Rpn family recombination-promoting nuclease/putative transposase [Treponema sp.]
MKKRKQFAELTIQDDFMFCKVMQNMNICKQVLELVLKEENIHIKKISVQHTIENNSEIKSVRLDVLAEDENENKFDIEMQMVNNDKIPKRMRLYQASIDVYTIDKGMLYADMPDTIIIFFCMFDPICKGLPIYTFENTCQENKDIKLNDGTFKIIINVKAYEKVKNPELKKLLKYICDGIVTNSLTEEIEMNVATIKQNQVFLKEYESFYARMQDERAEGRKEGRKEGEKMKALETASRMKQANCDISFIANMTGLTQEEIQIL